MTRLRFLAGLALLIWLVLPLVPLGLWSVSRGWFFPDLLPTAFSLDAWRYAMSDVGGVLPALWTTTLVALAATGLSLLVGLPAGRALGLYRFRGKRMVELLILAPVIVPGIAVVMGLHGVFIALGLTNTIWGVILVHLIPALPYMILVTAGVFANFDSDFEAQARSLGATRWQAFRHVTLPAILPGVVVAAMFTFLVSWSQYILTLMIGGGRVVTLPLMLFSVASAGRNDLTGAIGVVYVLPGLVVIALSARYLTGRRAALTGFGRI